MVFDTGSVVLFVIGIFLLYLCCWFFIKPLKWLFRLFLSCLLGAAAIWVFDLIGGGLGWHLALNPLTALITGVLGLPGMVMMLVFGTFL